MNERRNKKDIDFDLREGISKFFAQTNTDGAFRVDVIEKADSYVVEAELPGYDKADVSASLVDHWLEIAATRNEVELAEGEKYLRKERVTETLVRKIYLDYAINEKIDAKLENGILRIVIPMQTDTKSSAKIEIK